MVILGRDLVVLTLVRSEDRTIGFNDKYFTKQSKNTHNTLMKYIHPRLQVVNYKVYIRGVLQKKEPKSMSSCPHLYRYITRMHINNRLLFIPSAETPKLQDVKSIYHKIAAKERT